MRKKVQRRNFTLTEIMAVIGIAAVMLAVALPSFQKLGEARATQNLASELRGVFMQAQAVAATSGKKVAVLIDLEGRYITADRQTCRLCFVRKKSDPSTYDFLGWTQDSVWRKLPQGALVDPTTMTNKISFNTNPTFVTGETAFTQIAAVVFKPSGALDFPTATLSPSIVEAVLLDHTVIRRDAGDGIATVKMELNPFTGRAAIQ